MFHVVAKNHPKRKQGLCAAYYCTNKKAPNRTLCHKHKERRNKFINGTAYTYNALKQNAKRRGKEFTLTLEEFRDFCEETNYMEIKGRSKQKASIDRIDSSKGYSRDNIQIMSFSANSAKGNSDIKQDEGDLPF